MELLRLFPTAPLGAPHKMLEDVELQGFFLPKGTYIWTNLHAILRNPTLWGEDAEKFRPERFLNEDGTKVLKPEGFMPFAVGKRQCLGENLARDTLLLFVGSIFHKFKIEPDPEKLKADIEPEVGIIAKPKPFKVALKLRKN